MQDTLQKFYVYAIQYGLNIIAAIAILVIGRMVAKFACEFAERSMHRARIEKTLCTFTRHLAFYVIMTFVFIAALNKLGVETSSFIAVVGAASLAVGLALQGSLANFASGVLIVLF